MNFPNMAFPWQEIAWQGCRKRKNNGKDEKKLIGGLELVKLEKDLWESYAGANKATTYHLSPQAIKSETVNMRVPWRLLSKSKLWVMTRFRHTEFLLLYINIL